MARKKIKKFQALVGMIAVTTMLVLYFLAVPTFLGVTAGRVFSLVWLVVALVTLVAFGQKVFQRKRKGALAPVYVFRSPARTVTKMSKSSKQKGAS